MFSDRVLSMRIVYKLLSVRGIKGRRLHSTCLIDSDAKYYVHNVQEGLDYALMYWVVLCTCFDGALSCAFRNGQA